MDLDRILTERLAIVGGTGSGKSYTARGLVERVLSKASGRVGIIDPTGVWWGLRLKPDGKSAGFPVVLFGGDHSDVPLIETAGRVIGQAVASTHQSWIIDTSALKSKAAERRFMLDFLDAIFEANREDIVLVVDEADRFSPQRMNPESARLHERMEEIVRRGRVRGFTPWLLTQRPASLNKDVLSQATAYISMRMTGKHDRDAMGDVIEGQADKQVAKAIIDAMPRHKTGQGLVWAPQQDILLPASFPAIKTFDSMQAPKPGERRKEKALPPIDLGRLREKMATVETEAKANDPKTLKAEIAKLRAELAKKPTQASTPSTSHREDLATIKSLRSALEATMKFIVQITADGFLANAGEGLDPGAVETALKGAVDQLAKMVERKLDHRNAEFDKLRKEAARLIGKLKPLLSEDVSINLEVKHNAPFTVSERPRPAQRPAGNGHVASASDLPRAQQKILDTLAMLEEIGIGQPSKPQLALWCEVSPTSGGYFNNLGSLRSAGLIDYPSGRTVTLTEAGKNASNEMPVPTQDEMQASIISKVGAAKGAILKAVIAAYPDSVPKDELAQRIGVSPTSGGYFNNLGSLRTLGVIDYPQKGTVAAQPILFLE